MESSTAKVQTLNASAWLALAFAGIAFHAMIQWVEPDLFVCHVLGSFTALGLGFLYVDIQVFSSKLSDAASHLATSATIFVLALVLSMLAYRAFFHRLRNFRGPFLARLTKFYAVYQSRKLQYHLELERMHQRYGDVVRTGPRELSITRVSALSQIASCPKSTWYSATDWNQDKVAMALTRDLDDHRKRRRTWEMATTMKELEKYDSRIQSTIGLFLDRLANNERHKKTVNITEWIGWLSYDLMGIVGYGKDFGNLKSGSEHSAVQSLRSAQVMLGLLKPVPWLMNLLTHLPGCSGALEPFSAHCKQLVDEKRKGLSSEKTDSPKDILSWLVKAYEERNPFGPRTKEALDDDSRTLVVAGADTSYSTMVNALFYLASHPSIYSQLQTEIDAIFPDGADSFTYEKIKDVPLLDGVIYETLRLRPPVASGNPRVTPSEGLRIDDNLYIPGDVVVVMPQWLIQRDARYFDQPLEFVPERWIPGGEKAGMIKDRNAFFPFQIGIFVCVGKQLAMWEMRSVLARLALQFDISLAPGEDGTKFNDGTMDTWTLTVPALRMCFDERNKSKA